MRSLLAVPGQPQSGFPSRARQHCLASLSALHKAASVHADRPHRQARRTAPQAGLDCAMGAALHAGRERLPGALRGRYQTTVAASAHVLPGMVTSWLPGQNQGTTPVVAGRRRLLQFSGMAVLTQARRIIIHAGVRPLAA